MRWRTLLRLDSSHLSVPLPISPRKFVVGTMSTPRESSSSTPSFQIIFDNALKEYEKKIGKDLTTHPLAVEINGCVSPEAILAILEAKARDLDESQKGDEQLTKWLKPTVNILHALSATLGPAVGMVSYRIYLSLLLACALTLIQLRYYTLVRSSFLGLVSFSWSVFLLRLPHAS